MSARGHELSLQGLTLEGGLVAHLAGAARAATAAAAIITAFFPRAVGRAARFALPGLLVARFTDTARTARAAAAVVTALFPRAVGRTARFTLPGLLVARFIDTARAAISATTVVTARAIRADRNAARRQGARETELKDGEIGRIDVTVLVEVSHRPPALVHRHADRRLTAHVLGIIHAVAVGVGGQDHNGKDPGQDAKPSKNIMLGSHRFLLFSFRSN
jgi:hypothetical protein